MTNLISRSRRGRKGGRESGTRRERGVSILYFQRCIKHIATVTRQQQVPAQQVPREHRACFPPSLLLLFPLPRRAQPLPHTGTRVGAGKDNFARGQESRPGESTASGVRLGHLVQWWHRDHRDPDSAPSRSSRSSGLWAMETSYSLLWPLRETPAKRDSPCPPHMSQP